jgi:hypothetical protein
VEVDPLTPLALAPSVPVRNALPEELELFLIGHAPLPPALASRQRRPTYSAAVPTRANTRDTCPALHRPPRAAGTPRAVNPSANARIDLVPSARSSAMACATSCACASARSDRTFALAARACSA